ncbi:hypothetical protein [Roseomonas sp. BN140053]|uniref:hypothetical protein n=1 Tax=Roseomonas sp. BN140053 TaxID=3391898 RepID=UPI0039E8FE44
MATHAHSTATPRRERTATAILDRRARLLRQRADLAAVIERALALLDRIDGDPDLEPDDDGEEDNQDCCAAADDDPVSQPCRQFRNHYGAGDPDDTEASAQPATLAPFVRRATAARATSAEQRSAYRATGAQVPRELRRCLLGRVGA